jgi:hypothetical protein
MELPRWLVTHKDSGGVLSVVWDTKWYAARERAEQVWRDEFRRDQLLVEPCPLLPEEKGREHPYSAAQLAVALNLRMHHANDLANIEAGDPALSTKKKRPTKKKTKRRG